MDTIRLQLCKILSIFAADISYEKDHFFAFHLFDLFGRLRIR